MLESNTDRSYFMIGSVVVAGIIIAAAVIIFRDKIFGDTGFLTTTFKTLSDSATQAIDGIGNPTDIPAETIMGLGAQFKAGLSMLFM